MRTVTHINVSLALFNVITLGFEWHVSCPLKINEQLCITNVLIDKMLYWIIVFEIG